VLTAAAYSPDGQRLAIAGGDTVAVCDAVTGAPVWSLSVEGVSSLSFATDGRWLVVGSPEAVRLHDVDTGVDTGVALPGTTRAVAFVPDGYWAIRPDGTVELRDLTGAFVRDLDPHRATLAGWKVAGLRLHRPGAGFGVVDDADRERYWWHRHCG
jgi:hypothetical protein